METLSFSTVSREMVHVWEKSDSYEIHPALLPITFVVFFCSFRTREKQSEKSFFSCSKKKYIEKHLLHFVYHFDNGKWKRSRRHHTRIRQQQQWCYCHSNHTSNGLSSCSTSFITLVRLQTLTLCNFNRIQWK